MNPKRQNDTKLVHHEELDLMEDLLSEMERSRTLMWEFANLVNGLYRIYLLDGDGRSEAAEFYPANDEAEAVEIAASLYATCSDVFGGYELWRRSERIAPAQMNGAAHQESNLDMAALLKHQDVVLDLEDRLQNAFACVSRSRKLVNLARELRERQRKSFDD